MPLGEVCGQGRKRLPVFLTFLGELSPWWKRLLSCKKSVLVTLIDGKMSLSVSLSVQSRPSSLATPSLSMWAAEVSVTCWPFQAEANTLGLPCPWNVSWHFLQAYTPPLCCDQSLLACSRKAVHQGAGSCPDSSLLPALPGQEGGEDPRRAEMASLLCLGGKEMGLYPENNLLCDLDSILPFLLFAKWPGIAEVLIS